MQDGALVAEQIHRRAARADHPRALVADPPRCVSRRSAAHTSDRLYIRMGIINFNGRRAAEGPVGRRPGLRDHADEHDRALRDVHLLDVFRPHRARAHDRQAAHARRAPLAAHEHALQGRAHLLPHRVRPAPVLPRVYACLFTHASFVANLLATVFMVMNLNAIMSVIFNVPAAVASTVRPRPIPHRARHPTHTTLLPSCTTPGPQIVACRAVRRLSKWSNVGPEV